MRITPSLQETKPSSQDAGDRKDGEYIKLKVIGQVRWGFGEGAEHRTNVLLQYEGWSGRNRV